MAAASAGSPLPTPSPHVVRSLQIKYKITGRREGDVASCYADPALAQHELGWKAAFGLDKMCECPPSPARRVPPAVPVLSRSSPLLSPSCR